MLPVRRLSRLVLRAVALAAVAAGCADRQPAAAPTSPACPPIESRAEGVKARQVIQSRFSGALRELAVSDDLIIATHTAAVHVCDRRTGALLHVIDPPKRGEEFFSTKPNARQDGLWVVFGTGNSLRAAAVGLDGELLKLYRDSNPHVDRDGSFKNAVFGECRLEERKAPQKPGWDREPSGAVLIRRTNGSPVRLPARDGGGPWVSKVNDQYALIVVGDEYQVVPLDEPTHRPTIRYKHPEAERVYVAAMGERHAVLHPQVSRPNAGLILIPLAGGEAQQLAGDVEFGGGVFTEDERIFIHIEKGGHQDERDLTIRAWDVRSNELLWSRRIKRPHKELEVLRAPQHLIDKDELFLAYPDGTIQVYDTASGALKAELGDVRARSPSHLRFVSAEHFVTVSSGQSDRPGSVSLWSLETGERLDHEVVSGALDVAVDAEGQLHVGRAVSGRRYCPNGRLGLLVTPGARCRGVHDPGRKRECPQP